MGFDLRGEAGHHVFLQRRDRIFALQLVAHLESSAQTVADRRLDRADQGVVLGGGLPVPLRLAGFGNEFVDRVDRDLHLLVTEHHRAQHHVFGQFAGFGFDHQHGVLRAGDDEFQIAVDQFGRAWIEDVLAVLVTDLGGADRAVERGAAQGQRGGRADQGQDVAVDFRVQRHHGGDDLDFIAEVFREQRADRAIDQARSQRFLFGLATFALEEAARDAAAGVELFLVVDGEREEILPFARGLRGDGRHQHDGAFCRHHYRTAGLAGDLAGLEHHGVLAVLETLGHFCHVGMSSKNFDR